jgi:hypothetical protein
MTVFDRYPKPTRREENDLLDIRKRLCPCGSGKPRTANHDARGIFMCYTCEVCHQRKVGTFTFDIKTNPNYIVDEPIEEN